MDLQRVKHDISNGGYTIFEAVLSEHTLAQLKERCICSQGELQIFDQSGACVRETVLPALGTMVLFLSETVPHRVLSTHQPHYSISGWFRLRGSTPCLT